MCSIVCGRNFRQPGDMKIGISQWKIRLVLFCADFARDGLGVLGASVFMTKDMIGISHHHQKDTSPIFGSVMTGT